MRTIKCRVQRKSGEWEYFTLPKNAFGLSDVYFNQDTYYKIETFTEFTGLLDKNGNEIYEGDIAKIQYEDRVMECVYTAPYFWFKNKEDSYSGAFNGEDIEVIGNVWENPELIN